MGTSEIVSVMDPRSTPIGHVIRSTGSGNILVSTARNEGAVDIVIVSSCGIVLSCLSLSGVTRGFNTRISAR